MKKETTQRFLDNEEELYMVVDEVGLLKKPRWATKGLIKGLSVEIRCVECGTKRVSCIEKFVEDARKNPNRELEITTFCEECGKTIEVGITVL